jgi:hypothetical protein
MWLVMIVEITAWSYIYISTLDKISYILSSSKFSIKIRVSGDLFVISV